jgi:hypothetical protein
VGLNRWPVGLNTSASEWPYAMEMGQFAFTPHQKKALYSEEGNLGSN